MTHPDSPQEPEREALSDDALLDILRRLNLSGCKAVPLTRTVGPYEITEPTLMACVLADAIWQACAAAKDAHIQAVEAAWSSALADEQEISARVQKERDAAQAELAAKDVRIAELARELDAALALNRSLEEQRDAAVAELSASQAELAAVKEDAARYRWLRGDACPDHSRRWTQWEVRCWRVPRWTDDLRRADLDAAIDAERAARKEPK